MSGASGTARGTAATAGERRASAQRHDDVLVVEDDDFVRHALKRLLVSDGRECVAASSAEIAQQLLTVHAPALVITDLNLGGGLNGIDLLVWMGRSPRLARVPMLLMTADDPDETRRRLDAAGLAHVDILSKPFDRDALARIMGHLGA
jgi:two-component system aerobic respiration control protein ArcA